MTGRTAALLNNKLIAFVDAHKKNTEPRTLSQELIASLLEDLVKREREITGMITDEKTGDVFVCFSFTPEGSVTP